VPNARWIDGDGDVSRNVGGEEVRVGLLPLARERKVAGEIECRVGHLERGVVIELELTAVAKEPSQLVVGGALSLRQLNMYSETCLCQGLSLAGHAAAFGAQLATCVAAVRALRLELVVGELRGDHVTHEPAEVGETRDATGIV
jgi:hypothetical protein